MSISNDNIRRKQVGTSCVQQSNTPKYAAHILGGAVSKKYKRQHYNYDTPRYVARVLEGAVSKRYRHRPRAEIADTTDKQLERESKGLQSPRR